MHRLVWGIVIAAWGVIVTLGYVIGHDAGGVFIGILWAAGGGTLIFFGARYLNRRKTVTEFGLQMLRSDNKINAGDLAHRLDMSEIKVRRHLAHAQRKRIIPFKADIV